MNVTRTPDGFGLGWLPDLPDHRDSDPTQGVRDVDGAEEIPALLQRLGIELSEPDTPDSIDLSADFPPVEDQGPLGSCTAQAGVGLVEYFELQAFGKHIDASRLFVYKATRNLMGVTGDKGAFLRTTMQALALFGAPPEEYMPYSITRFDEEPLAFAYALAQSYRALQFYRLDPSGTSREALLGRIKTNLAAKLPAMFGFTVFATYDQAGASGEIPSPRDGEHRLGGHAVIAVGYENGKVITHPGSGQTTQGAIRIRNSYGPSWGDDGYGWLPYDYITRGLAIDWWSLIESGWVDSGRFGHNS
jgi:C1A family cysteine protease